MLMRSHGHKTAFFDSPLNVRTMTFKCSIRDETDE